MENLTSHLLSRDLSQVLLPVDLPSAVDRSTLLTKAFAVVSLVIFVSVSLIPAPYGRFSRPRFGFYIPALPAWMLQESPALLFPLLLAYLKRDSLIYLPTPNLILFAALVFHYFYRTIVYPLLTCTPSSKPATLTTVSCALYFCSHNGYMQAFYLLCVAQYPSSWLAEPRFICGMTAWFLGFVGHVHSDHLLRGLRKPGETGYKVPQGGLFEWISAANYGAECFQWLGFAVAACSPPAAVFSIAVFANLVPRALQYHRMYLDKFEDYPKTRKAIIPFLL